MPPTRSIKTHLIPGTIGLVVCGGQSSRMGTDKSLLLYHDKPQRYHLYDMLQPFCENVFISCNNEQAKNMEPGYDLLPDHPSYTGIGPMAALLSAFKEFPQKDILFIGCDYPLLNRVDLRQFAVYCNTGTATAFYNEQENIYEPLLAWYPYSSAGVLNNMQKAGEYSLQHFLKASGAIKFTPGNKRCMTSINTHEDYIKLSTRLFHERLTFF